MFANVAWNDLSLLWHSTTDWPIVNPLSKRFNGNNQATSYPNLVNFRPVISEFMLLKCAIFVAIPTI